MKELARKQPNKTKQRKKKGRGGRPSNWENWSEARLYEAVELIYQDKLSDEELCKMLGYSPTNRHSLYQFKASEQYKRIYEQIATEHMRRTKEALKRGARIAADGLIALATKAKSEEVRRKACVDILDRDGMSPREQLNPTQDEDKEVTIRWVDPDWAREKVEPQEPI